MSKKTENDGTVETGTFKKPKSFRMAYSLNNFQPVECTIISDQPLFYMDEEVLMDEDGLFSDDFICDDEFLEEELVALKNKIDAYERLSSDFEKESEEVFLEFLADGMIMSESMVKVDESEALERIITTLSQSRMSAELLKFATEHGVDISCSDQVKTAAFDKEANKILVRADIDFIDQVLLVVQELRRHWQYRQGSLVHPLTFHPDQAVLINRAQLADLSVAIVRCAWELKLDGQDQFWARIENSSMSDLGRALAREALVDFRTLNNGKASAAVFETWFLSERCRMQDKVLIQTMLADYRGYVFDSSEASRMVSINLICALGAQPYGKNYLAPYAQMIMNDPVFTDVRDRSNANFLWFIKFERTFNEAEQELQFSNHQNLSAVDQTYNNNKFEDNQNEGQGVSSQRWQAPTSFHSEDTNGFDGDNVIHVQFGADKSSREGILS